MAVLSQGQPALITRLFLSVPSQPPTATPSVWRGEQGSSRNLHHHHPPALFPACCPSVGWISFVSHSSHWSVPGAFAVN